MMDLGYGSPVPESQPGRSFELHFPAFDEGGQLGFVEYIDEVVTLVNEATDTFFAGYIALRFMGATRAALGMQLWNPTCSVEVSTLQGIDGLPELLGDLYRAGFDLGGVPHWGQGLDFGVQGKGVDLYPRLSDWRDVYARFSRDFTARTFENDLSSRWGLTAPP